MRGHAKGPFNNLSQLEPLPVLRVQKQIRLTPNHSVSVQIEATPTEPVLLKLVPWTKSVLTTGTNSLIVGNASVNNAYLVTGDSDPTTVGLGAEKRFVLTTAITLIAALTSATVAATKALTISAITAADTQTVTIGGQVYTFNTSLTNTANNVLIGADVTAMAANLASAINAGAGAGTTYGTGTVANTSVSATSALGVLTVTARTPGSAGNAITISETLTNGAWAGGATTLSGGAGADAGGEMWVFVEA